MNKANRNLPCVLSDREIMERSNELSSCLLEVDNLNDQKSALNAKIKPIKKRIDTLARTIDSREEERDVDCTWRYDETNGLKTLYRDDTGERVEGPTQMTELDRQRALDFKD